MFATEASVAGGQRFARCGNLRLTQRVVSENYPVCDGLWGCSREQPQVKREYGEGGDLLKPWLPPQL